ncbi:unnamed protein product [Closterium sp. NIES-53]
MLQVAQHQPTPPHAISPWVITPRFCCSYRTAHQLSFQSLRHCRSCLCSRRMLAAMTAIPHARCFANVALTSTSTYVLVYSTTPSAYHEDVISAKQWRSHVPAFKESSSPSALPYPFNPSFNFPLRAFPVPLPAALRLLFCAALVCAPLLAPASAAPGGVRWRDVDVGELGIMPSPLFSFDRAPPVIEGAALPRLGEIGEGAARGDGGGEAAVNAWLAEQGAQGIGGPDAAVGVSARASRPSEPRHLRAPHFIFASAQCFQSNSIHAAYAPFPTPFALATLFRSSFPPVPHPPHPPPVLQHVGGSYRWRATRPPHASHLLCMPPHPSPFQVEPPKPVACPHSSQDSPTSA